MSPAKLESSGGKPMPGRPSVAAATLTLAVAAAGEDDSGVIADSGRSVSLSPGESERECFAIAELLFSDDSISFRKSTIAEVEASGPAQPPPIAASAKHCHTISRRADIDCCSTKGARSRPLDENREKRGAILGKIARGGNRESCLAATFMGRGIMWRNCAFSLAAYRRINAAANGSAPATRHSAPAMLESRPPITTAGPVP